ncbi:EscU/YscU/HrcU family type III secretion system export apparatus switch protein [Shewanella sp. D64]|uniref:EscU/YscU/HrcU family type III secretion system export apparatus switch protein n=1 Tax=unclassified Shewanella TaxID=196818 RepID=UPI0022BA1154|nr:MULTISPECIES: EscU/YscU/HrcU family type III secretion system export apparatus switch protein [unclassified Shewanella]MEC4726484.1 EscU/YscU/HrcU family type III secretion system export apparatus switch protein [Shewanella sp. D64]MEC4737475.1 EscU/YscU/HrcU family type III secretion system export apparatus switch protein [Shewanella sp. E94]WBJ97287.1 EscU/YscU/HrcU family type III secretion system export apparatus switch protein [Shewanella sp. MTB7]
MKDDLDKKISTDPVESEREAVALGFDGHNAPKVTAKGSGIVADEIIALAKEAGIHIHQNAHLCDFLQRLELGDEIPKELYLLIAELIAFAYVLDGKFPEEWNNMHQKIVEEV